MFNKTSKLICPTNQAKIIPLESDPHLSKLVTEWHIKICWSHDTTVEPTCMIPCIDKITLIRNFPVTDTRGNR